MLTKMIVVIAQSNGCHLSLTAKMNINYSLDLKNNFFNVFDCIK